MYRDECLEVRCARGAIALIGALLIVLQLGAVYGLSGIAAVSWAAVGAYFIWELLPSWAVVLFEWLCIFGVIVGVCTLVILFPLHTVAVSSTLIALWAFFCK